MKILMIHHSDVLGGGTLSFFDIISALQDDKQNLLLSLPSGKNAPREKAYKLELNILNDDVKPLIFGFYNGGSNLYKVLIKYFFNLRNSQKWKDILRREKPDIVVLNSMILWPMIPILNSLNIKSIVFVRETMKGKYSNIFNRLIARNLKKADGVAYLSNFDKSQWKLPEKVIQTVIPDKVDVDDFKNGLSIVDNSELQTNSMKTKFYILYVGGMNELKGVRTIIHAIKQCKAVNIELLFLGDLGSELKKAKGLKRIRNRQRLALVEEIHKYIQENNLENNIRFVGMQSEMNYWYSISDVVVFPAKKAHQARPIYEAGVFKKPVIASNFPNYMEFLKPGISGLVFEPENSIELARAIDLLYSNPEKCIELGNKNYDLMNEFHNSKIIDKKIMEFVQEVHSL